MSNKKKKGNGKDNGKAKKVNPKAARPVLVIHLANDGNVLVEGESEILRNPAKTYQVLEGAIIAIRNARKQSKSRITTLS